jgi:hypothetical protein
MQRSINNWAGPQRHEETRSIFFNSNDSATGISPLHRACSTMGTTEQISKRFVMWELVPCGNVPFQPNFNVSVNAPFSNEWVTSVCRGPHCRFF